MLHVAEAVVKLSRADEPIHENTTTRRYLREISKLPDYAWLDPLRRKLDDPATAQPALSQIKAHDPEIAAMLETTVVPTMLHAGIKINVIPNTAEAELDVRRLPGESKDDVLARFRQIVNDPEVDVSLAPGQQMPAAKPSSLTTPLYLGMQRAIARMYPRDIVVPVMSRGATDSSYLRARGVAVYGVPLFLREGESRAHANDERISPKNLEDGVELLWQMVLETAGGG